MKIEIDGVSKTYQKVRALANVSLTIDPGQIVAFLGPNGAGKTTLLRCLAGIVAPQSGNIRFDGELFQRDRLDLRRRFLFLPDFPMAYPNMTPLRHIGMVLHLFEADQNVNEDRLIGLLRDFDLLPLADAPLATLSRGQVYKTALVALLILDPEVWLLDEPFASGMDSHGIETFKREAQQAAGRGHTVIYSTQILDVVERFGDRACIIHRGEIRAYETMEQLRRQSSQAPGTLEDIFRKLHEEGI